MTKDLSRMKMIKKQICLLGLALMAGTSTIQAQTLAQARTWYNEGEYAKAKL